MLESNLKKRSDRAMAQEVSKADIIKSCITSQVAVGGMIVALVKLL